MSNHLLRERVACGRSIRRLLQRPVPVVKGRHRGPVGDGHQRAVGLFDVGDQLFIHSLLGGLIQSAGGFVGKDPARLAQQDARDGQALLLTSRELLCPGVLVVQPVSQVRQARVGQCLAQGFIRVAGSW